mmetsp:Transcript_49846/g.89497  ORF Transcript_49846/g.89497 Transcript_49846/m.89497 type:complete len:271 (-) Transcript_49846:49-861(-)
MVKVRIQLLPDFGPEKGTVKWSGAVESSYGEVIKVVQSKFEFKTMKDVTLYCEDGNPVTRRILPHGDLSDFLEKASTAESFNGKKEIQIFVSLEKASTAGYSGYSSPRNEMATSLVTPLTISVMTLGGELFTVDAISSETVDNVKTKIQESKGVKAGSQKLLLGDVELSNDSKLEDTAISATTPLQLVVVSRFDIRLARTDGPNSPRFGCRSQYTWEMKCDCGHMETWVHADGYDFYSMSHQVSKTCPKCGAECRTKTGGPGGVPTKFPA